MMIEKFLESLTLKVFNSKAFDDCSNFLAYNSPVSVQSSQYQRSKPTVTWKGVNGASNYVSIADCSGFMSELLRHSYGDYFTPERFEQWIREKQRKRPLAEDFHYAIVNRKDFIQIKKLTQVQPGDIIAIEYPDGEDNTGHVMLVAETPQEIEAKSPLVKGTKQWKVKVVDQSRSGHGEKDSRRIKDSQIKDIYCRENDSFYCGLGEGTIRIYTSEENDSLLGYTWSRFKNSEYYCSEERDLVIGRLDIKLTG
ncbi:NlpC/P60 family protein [Nostoc commune]|uniref:NlpC/P60 family protein n=1 Tax=Nostoc commune TaxID=1178 RepID=UPI0018C6CA3A|nr:NlpC/P60 family protein [Nostoc commune]MBG1258536.1 hypothetical protein [Nostoc commune BAE]